MRSAIFTVRGGIGNMAQDIVGLVLRSPQIKADAFLIYWWHAVPVRSLRGVTPADIFDFDPLRLFCRNLQAVNETEVAALAQSAGLPRVFSQGSQSVVLLDGNAVSSINITRMRVPRIGNLEEYIWKVVRPVPSVMAAFAKEEPNIAKTTLGVHVRRTDHKVAVRTSTNDKFYRKIDSLLTMGYDRMFLATDDSEVEEEFLRRYGRIIYITKKSSGRRWGNPSIRRGLVTLPMLHEAFVDAMLLSRCTTVLGSLQSSFSAMAAKISPVGTKLVIVE